MEIALSSPGARQADKLLSILRRLLYIEMTLPDALARGETDRIVRLEALAHRLHVKWKNAEVILERLPREARHEIADLAGRLKENQVRNGRVLQEQRNILDLYAGPGTRAGIYLPKGQRDERPVNWIRASA